MLGFILFMEKNFTIGADENGKALFKDPQKAFEALVRIIQMVLI